jgi:hypothetical protein
MKAKEFDKTFDAGGSVLKYLDVEHAIRPGREQKRGAKSMFPTWSLFNFLAPRLATAWIQLLSLFKLLPCTLRREPLTFFYELNFFRPKPARPTNPRPSSSIVAGSGTEL